MSRAYEHPESGSIDLEGLSLRVTAENGHTASVPIGPDGLLDLAKKIKAHVANFDRDMCQSGPTQKSKPIRTLPERPFLASLGDCLAETAFHTPRGYSKITAVERDIDGPMRDLHLEAATACLEPAPVTIFIRAGVTPEHAREILKECAKNLKGYDTLEPWTPEEFLKSEPFADDETVPF